METNRVYQPLLDLHRVLSFANNLSFEKHANLQKNFVCCTNFYLSGSQLQKIVHLK